MSGFPTKLRDTSARNARPRAKPYKKADGGGLYLHVQPNGTKTWRYKFRLHEKEQIFSIGVYPTISLQRARELHGLARLLVSQGIHPTRTRQAEREQQRVAEEQRKRGTFGICAEEWVKTTDTPLAENSRRQRAREMRKYVLPEFEKKAAPELTRREISNFLKGIETHAPEVARNIRRYIYDIFEYAIETGIVTANPTPSVKLLAKRRQKQQPSLKTERVNALFKQMAQGQHEPQTEIAFRLVMLTMCRKAEVINSRWSEFNLDKAEWQLPAERMKMRLPHWVPLSVQAVALLKKQRETSDGEYVFPNRRDPKRPMANRSLNALMHRIGFGEEATVHGFRSMASTYLNESDWRPDIVEMALAHVDEDSSRLRYNRGELRDHRRKMLQNWADTLGALERGSNVVALNKPTLSQTGT